MHRGLLKMHSVPQKPVLRTEYRFRTVEAYFEHRVPLKTPSVQKKGVFVHRMPFSYRKSLFPVQNDTFDCWLYAADIFSFPQILDSQLNG